MFATRSRLAVELLTVMNSNTATTATTTTEMAARSATHDDDLVRDVAGATTVTTIGTEAGR